MVTYMIVRDNNTKAFLFLDCLKEKYFSYRRDKPKTLEAMIAYIGLV